MHRTIYKALICIKHEFSEFSIWIAQLQKHFAMRTKIIFILLACFIQLVAAGQVQADGRQIPAARLSKSGSFHFHEKQPEKMPACAWRGRNKAGDEQVAQLKALRCPSTPSSAGFIKEK